MLTVNLEGSTTGLTGSSATVFVDVEEVGIGSCTWGGLVHLGVKLS